MGGLEGKCFTTTALTFCLQEILLFLYLLHNSITPFKTVPVLRAGTFFLVRRSMDALIMTTNQGKFLFEKNDVIFVGFTALKQH